MGAEYIRNREGQSHSVTAGEQSVASGATVNDGDFVYRAGDRVTAAAIAGKRLEGMVTGGDAGNLVRRYNASVTGDAAGKAKVLVNIEQEGEYLVKANATVLAADEGSYFNLTGAAGAQLVDYASKSATKGQLRLVKAAPLIRGTDATYGQFTIAQPAALADDIGAS